MATITPKNIPKVWEEEQKPLREYVHEQLKSFKKKHPKSHAIIDAEQFDDELYSHRVRPGLQMSFKDKCVIFSWLFPDSLTEIKFYGDGIWSYEVTTPTAHLQFKGLGHPMSCKDFTYEKKRSPYIFVLDDSVEKYITLESEFENVYEPLFKRAERSIFGYSVSIAWTTNYYDGPLAGYCRHNNGLYYFDLIEETDIGGNRMFAMYKLSLFEQAKAYLSRLYWNTTMSIRPLHSFYMFKYRLRQKYEDWRYGKEYYKIVHKKHGEWKARHETVGFFT